MTFEDEKILHLDGGNELRFVLDVPKQKIVLQVLSGAAELFGLYLEINKDYEFSYFFSGAIYSPSGCDLKIKSSSSRYEHHIHTSTEVPKIIELYEELKSYRVSNVTNNNKCPITLITGPTDVGKSTLSRHLLNYFARHGEMPIFIDLDVGQSSLSISGTVGVLPIVGVSDCHGHFNEKELAVYFFGYKSPGHNIALYKMLLHIMSRRLKSRLVHDKSAKYSGVLIDTCGWVNKQGYQLIQEIIRCFEVDIIFAVGDSSLYNKLRSYLPQLDIRLISALEGVSYRNKVVRQYSRKSSVSQYFYGQSKPITPHVITVHFGEVQVYKAKDKAYFGNEAKNVRTVNYNSDIDSVLVDPGILYQVLGLSYADKVEDILTSSVYGFVCLYGLDMDAETATFLSPHCGPLPTKYFLMGDITFTPKDT